MTKDPIEETSPNTAAASSWFSRATARQDHGRLGRPAAWGHGKKVLIIQFMKGRKYGEVLCAEQAFPTSRCRSAVSTVSS